MLEKSPWTPRIVDGDGPVYRRIAAAISEDLDSGKIPPGARLPPQRELAYELKVGIGTITKAYNLLTRQGIGNPVKGSAMFVTDKPNTQSIIALNVNVPPNLMSGAMLSKTLTDLASAVEERGVAAAVPYEGSASHRNCLAAWLNNYCKSISAENMILCSGGQHAIWMALSVLAREPIVVVTDERPFTGLKWIVDNLGIEIRGVSTDRDGIRADRLEETVRNIKLSGLKPVLYVSPTAQNPTGISMSNGRIDEIAKVCRLHDVMAIEDDVYAAFSRENHLCLVDKIPERTFYVNSLAKILSPWFRLGVLMTPDRYYNETIQFMNTHGSKVSPIITHVMQEWIVSGLASEVASLTHQEGVRRNRMAIEVFEQDKKAWIGNGFHMFLPMSYSRSQNLSEAARKQGILVGDPAFNLLNDQSRSGVRICLGAPSMQDLENALGKIAKLHAELEPQTECSLAS